MNSIVVTPGIRASALALALALSASLTTGFAPQQALASSSSAASCGTDYDPGVSYPGMPTQAGADLDGEAGVLVQLHEDRAVVELEDCFYTLDRALEVEYGTLDFMVLLLELPEHSAGAKVFVSEDGAWIDTIETSDTMLSYVLDTSSVYGFEIARPGQERPTQPPLEIKPVSENPAP